MTGCRIGDRGSPRYRWEEIRRQQSHNNFKGHQVTKRLGILIAVIVALVAGGLALGSA